MAAAAVWTDVRTRLEAADLGGVPLVWPNQSFFEPGATFVAVRVRANFGAPIELGPGATWEEQGDVLCSVFVPEGTGYETAEALATTIKDVFRIAAAEPTAPVIYTGAEVMEADMEGDTGGYYATACVIRYRFHDRPA